MQKSIKVCPKCNSLDIRMDPFFWGGRIYQCRKCGFRSPLFPETPVKELEKKARKIARKKSKR